MAYSEKVIEHYENPRNVGSFDKDDPSVGTGLVGAPACGDVMKLQLKISADQAGPHRGIVLVEAPHVARVLVVLDDLLAVRHDFPLSALVRRPGD